ncbi:MAG TPA: DUF72 domain-containing protein [Actinomycetota bacterium]
MPGTLYTGTSGFAYKEWKGVFYPEGTKDREMLSAYASRLRSVEINYTFRRQASEKTLTTWREATPEAFRFTLKANQRITHWLRLEHADEAVREFLERSRLLGDRLGPILFQCPPNLEFDRSRIEAFVGYLPPGVKAAMEFRHPSWLEARPILAAQGVAWCSAETDEKEADEPSWEPFGYLRLRKTEYTDDELHKWAERISPALADGRDVFVYFKHEDGAASAKWAVQLQEMLSDSTSREGAAPRPTIETPPAPPLEPKGPSGPLEVYAAYSRAWNSDDPAEREALLRSVWADRAVYVDDEVPEGLHGTDALVVYIAESRAEMPGLVVSDTSAPKLVDGRLLVRWSAAQDREQRYSGTDVVEFAPDGRIARVTNFFDD